MFEIRILSGCLLGRVIYLIVFVEKCFLNCHCTVCIQRFFYSIFTNLLKFKILYYTNLIRIQILFKMYVLSYITNFVITMFSTKSVTSQTRSNVLSLPKNFFDDQTSVIHIYFISLMSFIIFSLVSSNKLCVFLPRFRRLGTLIFLVIPILPNIFLKNGFSTTVNGS